MVTLEKGLFDGCNTNQLDMRYNHKLTAIEEGAFGAAKIATIVLANNDGLVAVEYGAFKGVTMTGDGMYVC